MLARTSCLDRWPGELNEVDLLIQKNSKSKLVYYCRSIAHRLYGLVHSALACCHSLGVVSLPRLELKCVSLLVAS